MPPAFVSAVSHLETNACLPRSRPHTCSEGDGGVCPRFLVFQKLGTDASVPTVWWRYVLLTIQAEKLFRKSLKPSRCCRGNWYFTSAPSRVFSKQPSQIWRACSSISKGRCLA